MNSSLTQTESDLRIDLDGFIATLTICRPPNNYFDVALISNIVKATQILESETDARVIVLASEGKHFCAGADFGSRSINSDPNAPHLYEVAMGLYCQPLPIIAAVQGAAIGGGLGLALAADFRVAGEYARFSANFARLGFHHGFGLSVTLPRIVGQQQAAELLMTGRRIDVTEADRIGLVDRVVTQGSVTSAALEFAEELAASAPLAVRSIRATLRADIVSSVRSAMARERSEQERLIKTDDFREGISATAERRTPGFKGR